MTSKVPATEMGFTAETRPGGMVGDRIGNLMHGAPVKMQRNGLQKLTFSAGMIVTGPCRPEGSSGSVGL